MYNISYLQWDSKQGLMLLQSFLKDIANNYANE